MPRDDPKPPASLRAAGGARSLRPGDVPEEILAHYLTDRARGRTLGFFVDARATLPAFRDRGDRLFADRNDPAAIRAMVAIARHRGWSAVQLRGDEGFRREAWQEARRQGLEVKGYTPTPRDLEAEARRTRQPDRSPGPGAAAAARKPMTLERRAAIVEAVVAARMLDPDRARRLLDAARDRLAGLTPAPQRARPRER